MFSNRQAWGVLSRAKKDVVATFNHDGLRVEAVYHSAKDEIYPGSGGWSLIIHEQGKRARRVSFSPGFNGYIENKPQGEDIKPDLIINGLVFEDAGKLSKPNTRAIHAYTPAEQARLYATIEGAFDTLREGIETFDTHLIELEGTFVEHVQRQDYYDKDQVIYFHTTPITKESYKAMQSSRAEYDNISRKNDEIIDKAGKL